MHPAPPPASPYSPASADPTPEPPAAPPLPLPRGLIFLSFLWLVAAWGLAIGFRPPIQPTAPAYEPGVRTMLIILMLGLLVGWPLYRLSQPPAAYPARQTIIDLLVMLAMVQVIVWPLRLVTTWTRGRTAAIDLTILAWALIAGAIVALGIASFNRGPRSLCMATCVALCLLAPILAWLAVHFGVDLLWLTDWSPLMQIHGLGSGKGADPSSHQWTIAVVPCLVASLLWAIVLSRAFGRGTPTAGVAAG